MHIAVIGRGRVGTAIAEGWRRAGHEVTFGSRAPSGAEATTIGGAVAGAAVVALAVPWSAVPAAIAAAGDLSARVLIDCTNPLAMVGGRLRLASPPAGSGAQEVARLAPGARVVKTLNQTGAENIADPGRHGAPPAMFVATDDEDARVTALTLVADLGFEAIDAGPLDNALLLEALAMLWIDQATARGQGRDWAFARLTPRLSRL